MVTVIIGSKIILFHVLSKTNLIWRTVPFFLKATFSSEEHVLCVLTCHALTKRLQHVLSLSPRCVLQQFCGVLGHTFMEFLKGSGDYCQAQHAAYADE